jgi:hypothetical protein
MNVKLTITGLTETDNIEDTKREVKEATRKQILASQPMSTVTKPCSWLATNKMTKAKTVAVNNMMKKITTTKRSRNPLVIKKGLKDGPIIKLQSRQKAAKKTREGTVNKKGSTKKGKKCEPVKTYITKAKGREDTLTIKFCGCRHGDVNTR